MIDDYIELLNARKLGLNLMAFIQISMDKHTPDRFDAFEKIIADYPEVLECHLITGQSADYQLKVIVRDMDRSEEHTSELQSRGHLVCTLLLEKNTHPSSVGVPTGPNECSGPVDYLRGQP